MKNLIFLFLFLASFGLNAQTEILSIIPIRAVRATVEGNYDGDNLRVFFDTLQKKSTSIRLIGFDAPERKGICNKEQPCAMEAKFALAGACRKGSIIMLDTMAQGGKRDQYGRLSCRAWFNSSTDPAKPIWHDLGYGMLLSGQAHYVYNAKMKPDVRKLYRAAFEFAQATGIGQFDKKRYPDNVVDPRKWKRDHSSGLIYRAVTPFAKYKFRREGFEETPIAKSK